MREIKCRPLDANDVTIGEPQSALDILHVWSNSSGVVGLSVRYIPQNAKARITLKSTVVPSVQGQIPRVIIGGKSFYLTKDDTVTTVEISAENLEIKYLNTSVVTITSSEITLLTKADYSPDVPYTHIAVEAFVPRPGEAARWDTSRFNRSRFDRAVIIPGSGKWNEARFDSAKFYDEADLKYWRSLLPSATKLSIRRGGSYDGLIYKSEVGALSIETYNDADPRETGIIYGSPLRAFNFVNRTPIFTGTVISTSVTPLKPTGYKATISAADLIHQLSQIMRYGLTDKPSYPLEQRVKDLLDPHEIPHKIAHSEHPLGLQLAPTVYESNLTSHLDLALQTLAGVWWITKDGIVKYCPGLPKSQPVDHLTDTYQKGILHRYWYYTSASAGFDSTDLTTVIEVNCKNAVKGEDGKWNDNEKTLPAVEDKTLVAAYGRKKASITVNTLTVEDAKTVGKTYLNAVNPSTVARSVTLDVLPKQFETASNFDVMTPVSSTLRGETSNAFIASLVHEILPTKWTTILNLMETRK